jgi:hypothetical protein
MVIVIAAIESMRWGVFFMVWSYLALESLIAMEMAGKRPPDPRIEAVHEPVHREKCRFKKCVGTN